MCLKREVIGLGTGNPNGNKQDLGNNKNGGSEAAILFSTSSAIYYADGICY